MHVPSQVWVAPVGFLTGDDGFFPVDSVEPWDDNDENEDPEDNEDSEDPNCISSVDVCLMTSVSGPQRQWLRQYSTSTRTTGLRLVPQRSTSSKQVHFMLNSIHSLAAHSWRSVWGGGEKL